MRWLLAAVLVLGACKKEPPADPGGPGGSGSGVQLALEPIGSGSAAAPDAAAGPAVPPISVDEAGGKVIALMTKVGDAVTASGGDCGKLGTALKALMPDMERVNAHAKQFDEDPALAKAFADKFGDQIEKIIEAQQATLEKCKDNADVQAFFNGME